MKIVLSVILLALSYPLVGQMQVISSTPVANSSGIGISSNIEINFDQPIDQATVDGNIVLRSSSKGKLGFNLTGGGTSTLTIDPTNDFAYGEKVTVVVTSGLKSLGGDALTNGYSFYLVTEILPSYSTAVTLKAKSIDASPEAIGIGAADLDVDGDLDLVDFGYHLEWSENDGNENFSFSIGTHRIETLGNNSSDMQLEDMDNDGDMDIIVSQFVGDFVRWYENDGSAVFIPHDILGVYNQASQIGVGDFNNDGFPDVLATSSSGFAVTTLALNNGDGTFTTSTPGGFHNTTKEVALADFDNDGDLDAVARNHAIYTLAWLQNDGQADFSRNVIDLNVGNIEDLNVGDLDSDGDVDIVLVSKASDHLLWFENDGTGSFTRHDLLVGVESPMRVDIGDIDGDGDQDVVYSSVEKVAVLLNDGQGNYQDISLVTGSSIALDLVDLNEDGRLDILAYSGSDNFWIENKVNEAPTLVNPLSDEQAKAYIPFTFTLPGNAFEDPDNMSLSYTAMLSNGDPLPVWLSFDAEQRTFTGEASGSDAMDYTIKVIATDPGGLSASDELVLSVGLPSLMTLDTSTPNAFQSDVPQSANISLTFSEAIDINTLTSSNIIVKGSYSGILAGNLNGGGTPNIVFDPQNDFLPSEKITVLITTDLKSESGSIVNGNISYGFTAASGVSSSNPALLVKQPDVVQSINARHAITVDINNDGDLDIIGGSYNSYELVILDNDGAGNFTPSTITPVGITGHLFQSADIDADGDMDIVVAGELGNSLGWLENDGNEGFTTNEIASTMNNSKSLTLADLNKDGAIDVLVSEHGSKKILWYENNGAGAFIEKTIAVGSTVPLTLEAFDVDKDGDLDIVAGGHVGATNFLGWYKNNGVQQFDYVEISTQADGLTDLSVADFDNDGDPDIVTAESRNNAIKLYTNNGSQSFLPTTISTALTGPVHVSLVDVDGDTDLDVLAGADGSNAVHWIENEGSGYMDWNLSSDEGNALAYGDVDGDGDIDVISVSDGNNIISWFRNIPNQAPVVDVPKSDEQVVVGVGFAIDLNGIFADPDGSAAPKYQVSLQNDDPIPSWLVFNAENNRLTGTASSDHVGSYMIKVTGTDHAGEFVSDVFELLVEQPPMVTIVSASPKNQSYQPTNTTIELLFDKTLKASTIEGAVVLKDSKGLNVDGIITGGNSTTLSFTPNQLLKENELYEVFVSDQIQAEDGAKLFSSHVFEFRTLTSAAPGEFVKQASLQEISFPRSLDFGDFDGDGDQDLIVGSHISGHKFTFIDSHNFSNNSTLSLATSSLHSLVYDMDNDGDLDVISLNGANGKVVLSLNDGLGQFSVTDLIPSIAGPKQMALKDIDADGDTDLIVVSENSLDVYLNDGNLSLTKVHVSSEDHEYLKVVDFDMDGDYDILTSGSASLWYENDGFLNFTANTGIDFIGVEVLDIDRDGDMDVVKSHGNSLVLMENDGTLNFTNTTLANGGSGGDVGISDFDGDGDLDIAAAFKNTNELYYLRNNGDGTFFKELLSNKELKISDISIVDIDQDGTLDIVVSNYDANEVVWFKNRSNVAPTLEIPILDQEIYVGSQMNFQLLEGTFLDGDDDPLTYTASLADATDLPSWLAFDPLNLTFSGEPTVSDITELTIKVSVSDGIGGDNSDDFVVSVKAKLDQQITFAPLEEKRIDENDFELVATTNSGLDITYESSNTDIASVEGNMVSIHAAGSVTITASQGGNYKYKAAASVDQELIIQKLSQTVNTTNSVKVTFGDGEYILPAQSTAGLSMVYHSQDEKVAKVVNNVVTIVGAGTTILLASQAGDDTYMPITDLEIQFEVAKASQQIVFEPTNEFTYGDDPVALVAQSSSGLAVVFSSSDENVASITGNLMTMNSAGEVQIIASQSGNANYLAAEVVTKNFFIAKAPQEIDFTSLNDVTFGDPSFELLASSSSGYTVDFSSSNPEVATVANQTVTIVGAGSTVITASQPGDANYLEAVSVEHTLTVNKADQIISIEPVEDKTTEDNPFEIIATTTSGLALTYEVSGPATIQGRVITLDGSEGQVKVMISQEGNSNFNASQNSIVFEVVEAILGVEKELSVEVFPNPSRGFFYVKGQDLMQLSVYSLDAQKVHGQNIHQNHTVDLTHVPDGVYVFVFTNSVFEKSYKKIVKGLGL